MDQEGVASDGTYHIQGPVLTENEDYRIIVSITSIDNAAQPELPSDDFLLPSVNLLMIHLLLTSYSTIQANS
jgi:hypothetical protein